MTPTILSTVASLLYWLSAILIYKQLGTGGYQRGWVMLPALAAVLLHSFVLQQLVYQPQGLNLGLPVALSLVTWVIVIQILVSACFRRVETLGIIMFPMASLAGVFASLSKTEGLVTVTNPAIQGHIVLSIIAYSLVSLAAIQSGLLAYQDTAIRRHQPTGFVRFLPPLYNMEALLFQLLGFAFVFLTASLLSGLFFMEDMFEQQVAHKTVLSIVAWFTMGILLFGRFQYGWRGKTAIRWTLFSFAFLMLAYFGSKLVLEYIV